MQVNMMLPNGELASRTEIGLTKLDFNTLQMIIEVDGYDDHGNKAVVASVPYKLDEFREVTTEEIEQIVADYFAKNLQLQND